MTNTAGNGGKGSGIASSGRDHSVRADKARRLLYSDRQHRPQRIRYAARGSCQSDRRRVQVSRGLDRSDVENNNEEGVGERGWEGNAEGEEDWIRRPRLGAR